MVAALTQPCFSAARTGVANGGQIDPADKLYAAVKAYNTRQSGKAYGAGEPEQLFDAVKAFNARRTARLA